MSLSYDQYRRGLNVLNEIQTGAEGLGGFAGTEFGPVGTAIGTGLGWIFGEGLKDLYEFIPHPNEPGRDRFDWANLHEPGKKFYVQDPRWVTRPTDLNKMILPAPLTPPTVPILPVKPIENKGFNINNTDQAPAVVIIDDDGKNHTKQPHPSSRRIGNAAMPYNAQGFTARRQR